MDREMGMDKIAVSVTQHLEAVQSVRGALRDKIIQAAEAINRTLANAGKVLICGNGGSAADAQHFAAELTGRFEKERPGLPAIALTTDTSALTAIGNDYGFDQVFSRQLEALGREGDLLIGISTSGNSPNVLLALESARQLGIKTLGLTGRDGGRIADLADLSLNVAVERTARIQETHLLILHILCELIEADLS